MTQDDIGLSIVEKWVMAFWRCFFLNDNEEGSAIWQGFLFWCFVEGGHLLVEIAASLRSSQ